jgi:lysophospholipase L1-like esterase
MHVVTRRIAVFVAMLIALLGIVGVGRAPASTTRTPHSMAAIGDSITQAFDACCWYGNHPGDSWSTGGAGWDGVSSHYERLRALDPAITGHNYNDAVSGARMSGGPGQAQRAVDQGAQYVTIMMGANDLCTSSPSTMTSVDTFRSETRQTLDVLASGLPASAHIFVASIPNVYHLWELYHTDATAELVWYAAGICQSLLAPDRTDADRQAVLDRNVAFNSVLQQECAATPRCRFDGDAVFDYSFTRSEVSKLDYFHPSLSGQANLASVTWAASWWGG